MMIRGGYVVRTELGEIKGLEAVHTATALTANTQPDEIQIRKQKYTNTNTNTRVLQVPMATINAMFKCFEEPSICCCLWVPRVHKVSVYRVHVLCLPVAESMYWSQGVVLTTWPAQSGMFACRLVIES